MSITSTSSGQDVFSETNPSLLSESHEPQLPTILLIDDNAVQAVTRQTILRRAGYNVIAALNPCRALTQLQHNEFQDEIDLVVTDHLMPGMTGAEFVRELRHTHTNLPVLVISGMEEAQDEYEGLDVNFRLKPLLPNDLIANVQHLLAATSK